MNTRLLNSTLVFTAACCLLASTANAQTHFQITFRGTAYQKDATGNIVPVPITERTLVEDAAKAGGVSDLATLALVYHVNGSSFGDTIDVVNATNGIAYVTLLGFFFAEDPTLNRTALTNSTGTQIRRIDYVYTKQNSHSMGTGFVTKRYVSDGRGGVRGTIDGGQVQWIVLPENGNSAKICRATFTTTRPFTPRI